MPFSVWLRLESLSPDLARKFSGLSPERREAEVTRLREHLAAMAAGIRRQTRAAILWFGFELPVYPALATAQAQTSVIGGLNQFIGETLRQHGNAYLIDLNRMVARVGWKNYYDARYGTSATCPMAVKPFGKWPSRRSSTFVR